MRYGSVCSGIESASIAWEPLGLKPAWFSEIEKKPSELLAHHWPDVENLGDMTALPQMMRDGLINAPDILVGGTPCQAFSVAGARKGLDDERGQLTLTYVDLLNAIDERRATGNEAVALWENVPGVLSSKDNAFGCFLGLLAGEDEALEPPGGKWKNAGYVLGPQRAIAWRVLDAQYFGVAQRRRRVFLVASARNGFDPRKVLFESEGVRRDSPPSREAGLCAAALTANGVGTCGADDNQAQARHLVVHGTQNPCVSDELAFALGRNNGGENVIFTQNSRNEVREMQYSGALTAHDGAKQQHYVRQGLAARRLLPVECERLQGFPDGHTDVANLSDSARYKALGNSKAVPVVQWVGKRLLKELGHEV